MGSRQTNPRLAKVNRNYSVQDIVGLYGVHKNTVLQWFKNGLQRIDGRRPALVLGSELRRFLRDRQLRVRSVCKLGEIYCVRCRAPRWPAGDLADYAPRNENSGLLVAICPSCDNLMFQAVSVAKLQRISLRLDVAPLKALGR